MKNKREIQKEKIEISWNKWCEKEGAKTVMFTDAEALLSGKASDEEYAENEKWFASYDGDFVLVRPHERPITITGKNAKIAWSRTVETDE